MLRTMINLICLPTVSAVYRVWHRGRVVYIGQTINLKERWKSHHVLPMLISLYGLDWEIDWVEITPSNLNRAEAFAYRNFKPEINQRNPSDLLGFLPEE